MAGLEKGQSAVQDPGSLDVGAEVFLLSASHDRLAPVAENIE